jgi:hypothetical protein
VYVDGVMEKFGYCTTVTVVVPLHELVPVVPETLNTVVAVRDGAITTDELEVKPFGPVQVNELTEVLVFTVSVGVLPAQIAPEFVGVTMHTRPQFVVPAFCALEFTCWIEMFWADPLKLVTSRM